MARSSFLIGAVILSPICMGISNVDSSNGAANDSVSLLPVTDIVIQTAYTYLQEQEQRLANLREHIEDHPVEHKIAIHEVTQTSNSATQESANSKKEKIEKEVYGSDVYRLYDLDDVQFKKLCRGQSSRHAHIQKELKCRYVDHGIPFLKIAPFKEEEANLEPRILIYHDVIYDEEIETLKGLSEPKLESAKTVNHTSGEHFVFKQRTAKSAWIEEAENDHAEFLNRRMEHMTGLTVNTAEDLQVTYYDIGGFYIPHHDFFQNFHLFNYTNGNRIATVLFYLNDVAEGGGTAFPDLNFTVWPKKGSAVFWYNLKRNGEENLLLLHGACPVLLGKKWIATKWFRQKGQELRRPCTLSVNE